MTTLREAAQQALEVLVRASSYYDTYAEIEALRAALEEQPQTTHWQGCEEVHPECAAAKQAGCAHCRHPLYCGIKCGVCGRSS